VTVFVVVGPPAVGKSTVTRLLADALERSVLVEVDHLRDGMVVNGAVLPTGGEWSAALVEQLEAARASACAIAHAYAAIGFDVVIDDFYDPESRLVEYEALDDLGARRVLLRPNAAVARERSRDRGAEAAAFIAVGIEAVYAAMPPVAELEATGWLVLDTSEDRPEQTRDRILALQ
jgi:predicted kinase